ncbi:MULTISPECIES: helix-turn-helix transcriptional regulator [Paenibacillus]|uniref:HTH cro/C1-type domain-containing protein n=1 Tax=Paenibacillus odorifer TaxID=189426 RepID=A0A1R0XHV6_9BACL|nr:MULTISPECIES: helix-turn-helix transcriptional regulator [Paenibacillus]AIQ34722.1 hypothetical protein R50345_08925 [Paenibacillus sp. FSL R5-0345]OMD34684.1 hypothetical protein BSK52_28825 [Paenibacillus odorifer]
MIDYKSLGEYITFSRTAKGLSKSELARRVGITPQYMRDIEDNRTIPSEEKLELMVNVLDMKEVVAFKLADKLPLRIINKAKMDYFGG